MTCFAFVQALPVRLCRVSSTFAANKSRPVWLCCSNHSNRARFPTSTSTTSIDRDVVVDDYSTTPYEWDVGMGTALSALIATGIASIPSEAQAIPETIVETFKSIPVSLVHPTVMWGIFGSALYAGWLGWQSRQIRSVDADKRKELVKSKVTKRHFELAAVIFAIMTCATFTGMANTYARTGKLFPGPHLYAGLGLVATMSVMSSLVPQMQSGKKWARDTHLALAVGAISLFGWQAKSGMAIVFKLLGWDK